MACPKVPTLQAGDIEMVSGGFRVLLRQTAHLLRAAVAAGLLVGSTLAIPQASSAATPVVSLDPTQKIHPLLQYGASVEPVAVVRVIVQKNRQDVHDSNG